MDNGQMNDMIDSPAVVSARIAARLHRIQCMLAELNRRHSTAEFCAKSPDNDICVTLDDRGRLVALSLASDCTTRYTNTELVNLINSTLSAAAARVTDPCQ
jgi:hypothetical protein